VARGDRRQRAILDQQMRRLDAARLGVREAEPVEHY
jgi:hypothetical protein